jgi:hypothetical protein
MPELAEAEEASLQVQLEWVVENRTKNSVEGCPGGLEKSTSSLLESRGYFRLEAHQVLRLAYILTFTMLNTRGLGHISARFYEGGVVLSAKGQSNVLECSRIFVI